MRRAKNEITNQKQILEILRQCQVCRLAINTDEYPYIIPVNYGFEEIHGKIYIYIHGADTGTKKELIKKDDRVGFEMDLHDPVSMQPVICDSYMNYVSICGNGRISFVREEEKANAMEYILKHYSTGKMHVSDENLSHIMVLKIEVNEITGKFLKH